MYQNTTRLQATGANLSNWSHQWVGNVWKYNKIAGNRGKCKLLKPPVIWPCAKIQQDSRQATNNCAMCENTTKLQATGENWSYWSHHVWKYNKIPGKRPVSLHCLRLQEDCRQRGKIWVIEATNHCAMCENTTRLPATGRNVNYWSHELSGHVWKYNKIPGKPPIIVQCVKIQRDCRQRGKMEVTEATMCENTTRFQASDQLVCNVWKYNKIVGNGENI